ncbi:MAG: Hsp20 family protein, partial [Anaerolineae bacterium]|nr:Hsp20 family protein [Anaerolineae bacterium]
MAALIRWNPIRELAAMERMMDAMAHRTLRPTDTATGALALDVSEADNVYTVTTALPGVKADDIQIHLKDGVLTISAEIPQRVNERKDGERVL